MTFDTFLPLERNPPTPRGDADPGPVPSRSLEHKIMPDYDNERWVELYCDALAELEQFKIRGRIGDARAGIATRVEKLTILPGLHAEELQAIDNALDALRFLEREENRYDEIQRLRAVSMASLNLQSLGPRIKKLANAA